MKQIQKIIRFSIVFSILFILILSVAEEAFAILPPVRNVALTNETSGSNKKYTFSVFDEQSGLTKYGNTGFVASNRISSPSIRDGVVVWSVNNSQNGFTNYTVYYAVYDPKLGVWKQSSSALGTNHQLSSSNFDGRNGIIRWRQTYLVTASGPTDVIHSFATYDPLRSQWKVSSHSYRTSSTISSNRIVYDPSIGNDIAYWIYIFNNGGAVEVTVHTLVYDGLRGGWSHGSKQHYLGFNGTYQIDSYNNGTVKYRISGSNLTRGYHGSAGFIWSDSDATPVAHFVPTSVSGSSPLKTYFWDMSVGGSVNWNFGNGQSSSVQSPFFTYFTSGGETFTATQYVSGAGGSTSYSQNISITTPHSISGNADNESDFDLSNATVSLTGASSATAQTDSNGNFSFANLVGGGNYTVTITKDGYTFTPPSINFNSLSGNQTADFTGEINNTPSDFDGDGKSDLSIYRPNSAPTASQWWVLGSLSNSSTTTDFGLSDDKVTPRDFDGDGKTDIAIWRPSEGKWYVLRSSDYSVFVVPFGTANDITVADDYDGDDLADLAVFRPSNRTWYILRSSDSGVIIVEYGTGTDKPVQGDYDGDGKADIAVFRPSENKWYVLGMIDYTSPTIGKPAQGDYDGDGKTDFATYEESTGIWEVLRSSDQTLAYKQWGISTDILTPGDYDGDGKYDHSIYRPSEGKWYILQSSNQIGLNIIYGNSTDYPTLNSYIPE